MNSPGTTIIEGKVVGISKYNQTTFKLRTRDGQEIEYTIPVRIAHMMQLIKRGVYVKIMDTPSGPKEIYTYSKDGEDVHSQQRDNANTVASAAARNRNTK